MRTYKHCSRCQVVYPEGFQQTHTYCDHCVRIYQREWRKKNAERESVRRKEQRERYKAKAQTSPCRKCGATPTYTNGYCKTCQAEASREWRKKNPEKDKLNTHAALRRGRKRVIDHYGGKCACCGEATYEFLALDHINGDGGVWRRQDENIGKNLWRWARQNNYPDHLRVLCHNCNSALGSYGYCPHQRPSTDETSHER